MRHHVGHDLDPRAARRREAELLGGADHHQHVLPADGQERIRPHDRRLRGAADAHHQPARGQLLVELKHERLIDHVRCDRAAVAGLEQAWGRCRDHLGPADLLPLRQALWRTKEVPFRLWLVLAEAIPSRCSSDDLEMGWQWLPAAHGAPR